MSHSFSPVILPDYDSLSRYAASKTYIRITEKISKGDTFVLGMATGNTPISTYKYLVELLREYKGDLTRLYTVNLDEYYPMKRDDPNSYYTYMVEHFWEPISKDHPDFNRYTQGIIPDGNATDPVIESAGYEAKIKELGGIDLQILGIGTNGHIGFNEPGTPGNSRTGIVRLAEETIEVNKAHFGGDPDTVPQTAFSMGIGTILEAREIFLIASGKSKEPVMKELLAATKPYIENPASFLITHSSVSIFLDKDASGVEA